MTIEELIRQGIIDVARYEERYYVVTEQTDHGDDSVYWVDPETLEVEYDSYVRLLGEKWFDKGKLRHISTEDFIRMVKGD